MANPDEKALSLIPDIQAAYDALVEAEGNTLKHKVTLGEKLKLAKEAVQHGKFKAWLKDHFPKISHRSANVYMDLAKRLDQLGKTNSQRAAILVEAGSIREALKDTRTDKEKADAKAKAAYRRPKAATPQAEPPPAQHGSTDLADALADVALDEVVKALRQAGWDDDKLLELVTEITDGPKPVPISVEDDLSIPPVLDRTHDQPTAEATQ